MIIPLKLGNSTFPHNIIQGPLAGVSCAPFRYLTWKYGRPAFSYTEMISCKTIIHQPAAHKRYLSKHPEEGPVGFQLSGNQPHELAEAVKIITDHGADLIDLNCGCPVNKIRGKGAGSKLLTNPLRLYQLITAMKENTPVPVSVKIRVDGASDDQFNHEIAKVVAEAGADFLIVHGRHWTEHYETACRYDQIRFFVEALKIPVIGNGDIACVDSLKKMFATGCAGVMLSRAGMGRPWLTRKLIADMNQETYCAPALAVVGDMFVNHVTMLAELLEGEKFAILQARKFAKYYAREISDPAGFCRAINICEELADFKQICTQYFVL